MGRGPFVTTLHGGAEPGVGVLRMQERGRSGGRRSASRCARVLCRVVAGVVAPIGAPYRRDSPRFPSVSISALPGAARAGGRASARAGLYARRACNGLVPTRRSSAPRPRGSVLLVALLALVITAPGPLLQGGGVAVHTPNLPGHPTLRAGPASVPGSRVGRSLEVGGGELPCATLTGAGYDLHRSADGHVGVHRLPGFQRLSTDQLQRGRKRSGIAALTLKSVDFAASDAPLSGAQTEALPAAALTLPDSLGAISVMYRPSASPCRRP